MLSINFSKISRFEQPETASTNGKSNLIKRITTADEEGRLIYNKKENEESSQGIPQVQYEGNINDNSSFNNSILNPDRKINEQTVNKDNVQKSDREYSYNELISKGNVQGIIVEKTQQVKLTTNDNIDVKWVIDEVRKNAKKHKLALLLRHIILRFWILKKMLSLT